MKARENTSKTVGYLALLVLLVLGIGAGLCYRERMLFVDPAWIVLNTLNTGSFVIAEHRWGAFITQAVPLLGGKTGLPLKAILLLYSLSFYLFYGVVVWLAGRKFKEPKLALLLALYLTLFVTDSYYWPNNEVHQGTAWGILFLAAFFRGGVATKHSFGGHLFLVATLLLALSSHLLVALPLSFLWVYRQWRATPSIRRLLQQKEAVCYTALIISATFFRYWLSSSGWYDGGKLESVKALSVRNFLSAFSTAQSRSFLALLATHYVLVVPLVCLGFWALLRHRQFFLFGITALWAILYYGLVCTVFTEAITPATLFYNESEWLGLSLILVTPFVMEGSEHLKWPRLFLGILVVLFAVRMADIAHSYLRFSARYQQLAHTTQRLQNAGIPKAVILLSKQQSEFRFLMSWGTPVESLMLSELEGYQPAVSFKIEEALPAHLPAADSFLSAFSTVPAAHLNRRYFRFDTTVPYQVLEGAKIYRESFKAAGNSTGKD